MSATPPTDPSDPNYWPGGAPSEAVWVGFDVPGHDHWTVYAGPPAPWPYIDEFPAATYGPKGTVWYYRDDFLAHALQNGAEDLGRNAVRYFLSIFKLSSFEIADEDLFDYWVNPGESVARMSVSLYRVTIHAKVNEIEESVNILHYLPAEGDTVSDASVQAVADLARDSWVDFLASASMVSGSSYATNKFFSPDVVWDEVRCAGITLAPPAKPHYDVLTKYSSFDGTANVGHGEGTLPYEVACCLSYVTAKRGPRYRGRSYLGPLGTDSMASNGLLNQNKAVAVGLAFGNTMIQAMAADATNPVQLVIASGKFGTSELVTGVRVGQVPDSQRRRRRSQPEAFMPAFTV